MALPCQVAAHRTSFFLEHRATFSGPYRVEKVTRSRLHKAKQGEKTTVFWP